MNKNVVQTAIFAVCIALLVFLSAVEGAQLCEWEINECPINLDGEIITVPSSVIALSSKISSCNAAAIAEDIYMVTDTPAIMFVIDNSTSMTRGSGFGGNGNDVDGTRFTVTKDLLDTIFAGQPGAYVGLVVFRSGLYLDQRTHDILVPLEGVPAANREQENQAYLPPLKLDSTYSFNGTAILGIDIIKFFLQTTQINNAAQLVYEPIFTMASGTNINNAFEGALQGLQLIPEEVISRDQRFVVFLSDGEPQPFNQIPDSTTHGGKHPYYFKSGLNTPTTFTVYLHNTETEPPDSLVEMTENIRNNGYSESNPNSDIWILQTNYDTLMSLFINNIINPILTRNTGHATFMVINSITSTSQIDSSFVFNRQFVIEKDTTVFELKISYNMSDEAMGRVYDTTILSTFTVVRSDNVSEPSEGAMNCWNRDLSLFYNGSPVTVVNETMNNLEVVFETDTAFTSVTVLVTHKNGPIQDFINLPLSNNVSAWSEDFTRLVGNPVTGDRILQHEGSDSIILIYRNSQNPLDTIRKAYPFSISKILSFPAAYYFDNNADGFIDSIFIEVNGAITHQDLSTLQNLIHLPEYRNFRIDSISLTNGGLAYHVVDGIPDVKTYVTSSDVIIIDNATLPTGGIVTSNIIGVQDRVAPVLISGKLISSATSDSLQVVFSEPIEEFISRMPILFSQSDGTVYQVELDEGGVLTRETHYASNVASVQSGFSITSNHYIWINPTAGITDIADNIQINPRNRKVSITVQEIPYIIVPKVINNPFNPTDEVPEVVRAVYERNGIVPPQYGLVIIVEPQGKILRSINLQGSVSVYDVVKNPIIKDIPGVFDTKTKKLYFAWGGINSNGRKVGTGTYTAIIQAFDENINLKKTSTLRLGVKR